MVDAPSKTALIPAQRRSLVFELVRRRGVVSVQDLSEAVDASLSTIRRDLDWLARCGKVQRSHGGASIRAVPGTTFEPAHEVASRIAEREKAAIGRLAAERLRAHQSVIFDSGSTVFEAARQVARRGIPLTAVTNDLRIAGVLSESPSVELIVSGGTLRRGSYTLLGEPGLGFLGRLHVDVALMGIHAVSEAAFCDTSTEVAMAKRLMAAAGGRTIVLADAAKFGVVAFCDAFSLADVDEIITDEGLPPEVRRRLEAGGVAVSTAPVEDNGAA
jgi:DeoR family transcriptional regulator of aga operon